jgi:hypothetical protein
MAVFEVASLVFRVQDLVGVRSQPTLAKWKRAAGIAQWAKTCEPKEAEYFVAVALLRSESPTKAISKADVVRYACQNRGLIAQRLMGVVKQPNLVGEYSWPQVSELVRDHSTSHQKPSQNTLINWAEKLGLKVSRSMPVNATDVYRLIEQADVEAAARVRRGQLVGRCKQQMKIA